MSWNSVVWLGLAVALASLALARGARTASEPVLARRCRLAIWLALGYAGVMLVAALVPLARFAWATWFGGASDEQRALLLGQSLAAGVNLVFGFLVFGIPPSGVAFMLARRLRAAQPEA